MEYIIALSQLLLFIIFSYTLKCEVSKEYSDSLIPVSIRTFIMCTTAILFFVLFEKQYQTSLIFSLIFIPITSVLAYLVLNKVLPRMKIEDVDSNDALLKH